METRLRHQTLRGFQIQMVDLQQSNTTNTPALSLTMYNEYYSAMLVSILPHVFQTLPFVQL